ncbi:unnamed protein product [Ambrosiozyma monospora]|uniref:Unnamed protein product n=1 Tax=Ambrosiozyma monospora TaxID=43982 RepID=A0A9W6Z871_AMBMO|nr:unnamed protein product [Ambrosiozyma monospora]
MLDISDGLFYTPSMLVDVRLGRMVELETIVGNPLRIAKRLKVDTPHLEMIYGLLKLVQFRIKEKMGIITVDKDAGEKAAPPEEYGSGF